MGRTRLWIEAPPEVGDVDRLILSPWQTGRVTHIPYANWCHFVEVLGGIDDELAAVLQRLTEQCELAVIKQLELGAGDIDRLIEATPRMKGLLPGLDEIQPLPALAEDAAAEDIAFAMYPMAGPYSNDQYALMLETLTAVVAAAAAVDKPLNGWIEI